MPRVRITKKPSKNSEIPGYDVLGEMVKRKGGKIRAKSDGDQGYPFQRDQGYMYDQDMGGVITKMHVPDMDGNMYFTGGPINGVLRYDQNSYDKGGYLRGNTKENTRMKKGGNKKDRGGVIYPFGRSDGPEKSVFDNYDRGGVIYPFGRSDGPEKSVFDPYDRGGVIYPFGRYDGEETDIWDNENFNNGGLYDQNLIGTITNPDYMKKGGWLKGAVNPKHRGYCTPMTKSTCTGHRRAFALMMKKKHGFHKKEDGGNIDGEQPGPKYNFKNVPNPTKQDSTFYRGAYASAQNMSPEEFRKEFLSPYSNIQNNPRATSTTPEYMQFLKRNYDIANNAWYDAHSNNRRQDRGGVIYPIGGGDPEQFKQGGKYIGAGPNTDLNPTTNHSIADYNPYVYFKNKNWYITSNPEDEAITESVKPVDESVANIEAEKGEYMVKPGLTGLYKVTGKTHAEGGTPLYAEGGSFIFSNDPKLAINKNERDAFGFKGGSSTSKSKNTPAQVLGREVNPKEYNGYIATLESPDTDRIAKTTAALMLEKLQQKLGQVAYLQENKKGTKPPDFSQGTAPVTQSQLQGIDQKMSEYRMGGYYDTGGGVDPVTGLPIDPSDQYPGGKTKLGRITPTGVANNFNYPGGVPKLIKDWQGAGVDLTNLNSGQAQGAMYDWALKNNPGLIRGMWNQYGDTAQGKNLKGNMYDFQDLPENALDTLRSHYTDGLLGARVFAPTQPRQPQPYTPGLARPDQPNVQAPPPGQPATPIQNTPSNPTLPYQIKGKLTDAQMANMGYLGLQALNINRYMPTRQQVSLPQVKLDQINVQPYLNQINNQAHEAYEVAALNPRTSNLMASNIRGTAIDQSNQAIGNVANQNAQIGNQQNLTNLQQMTQQVMANSQFNNQYYNEVQATNQNFDNERRFANNQFVSNLNNYQSQADKMAWQLASVNRYGTRTVTDPKTGRQYNLPTPLYEMNRKGFQYNADVANLNMASGANRINTPQEILQTYNTIAQGQGITPQLASRIVDQIIRARGTQQAGQGPFYMQNPFGAFQ